MKRQKRGLPDGFDLRPIREILQEQIDKGNIDALWQMAQLCKRENDETGAAGGLTKPLKRGRLTLC